MGTHIQLIQLVHTLNNLADKKLLHPNQQTDKKTKKTNQNLNENPKL